LDLGEGRGEDGDWCAGRLDELEGSHVDWGSVVKTGKSCEVIVAVEKREEEEEEADSGKEKAEELGR
jgi:hypothetical protein